MNRPPERKRPTHTVILPDSVHVNDLVVGLLANGCTFTVEPGAIPGVWHVGLFPDGLDVLHRLFGPSTDIGTVGEHR